MLSPYSSTRQVQFPSTISDMAHQLRLPGFSLTGERENEKSGIEERNSYRVVDEEIMKRYCPKCRQEIKSVGTNAAGSIYVCRHCYLEWVIEKKPKIFSVKFHKAGAVSIDGIHYDASTEIARFFTGDKEKRKKTINVKGFEVIAKMMVGKL